MNRPRKPRNRDVRPRGEYLREDELKRIMAAAAAAGRHGHRDATAMLIAYRHALRASELVNLAWSQVDLDNKSIHIVRSKNGTPSVQPLRRDEVAALRELGKASGFSGPVFPSERGGPMSTWQWNHIVKRAGAEAGFDFPTHSHMLRHTCGYLLAMDGKDTRALQVWMGHVNIQHTTLYTRLTMSRFVDFFADGDDE
jgi:type 1 fimbriae regulatory protein FimB/type 1 fimbriae regulatory protein FimE